MVRHIVAWNCKEGLSEAENKENALKIKQMLEALPQSIPGIIEMKVCINTLPPSNRPMLLNSLFESEEALAAYQVHPEHQKAAGFIRSVTQNRIIVDYYV